MIIGGMCHWVLLRHLKLLIQCSVSEHEVILFLSLSDRVDHLFVIYAFALKLFNLDCADRLDLCLRPDEQ